MGRKSITKKAVEKVRNIKLKRKILKAEKKWRKGQSKKHWKGGYISTYDRSHIPK